MVLRSHIPRLNEMRLSLMLASCVGTCNAVQIPVTSRSHMYKQTPFGSEGTWTVHHVGGIICRLQDYVWYIHLCIIDLF